MKKSLFNILSIYYYLLYIYLPASHLYHSVARLLRKEVRNPLCEETF